jgi:hypothetical protein
MLANLKIIWQFYAHPVPTNEDLLNIKRKGDPKSRTLSCTSDTTEAQALVSFKKYMPPLLPYFKVNICPKSSLSLA